MHGQCLVAVYPSRNEAEKAFRAARGSGVPSHNIRMSGADMERPQAWDWLFSLHVPEKDKTYYRAHLSEGRTALSVLIDGDASPAKIDAMEEILDRFRPLDVRVEQDEEKEGPAAAGAHAGEEIVPLPREKATVSTRSTDRVRRVRTYVVEEPFEKEVSLSDEKLVVERRPATSSSGCEITEREYEFHERHDEPVVEKNREDEELAISKQASEHTERVRGTVKRTRVAVDKGSKQTGISMKPPGNR